MYIQEELSQIVMDAVGSALIKANKRVNELEQLIDDRKHADIVDEANARMRRTEEMEGKA